MEQFLKVDVAGRSETVRMDNEPWYLDARYILLPRDPLQLLQWFDPDTPIMVRLHGTFERYELVNGDVHFSRPVPARVRVWTTTGWVLCAAGRGPFRYTRVVETPVVMEE